MLIRFVLPWRNFLPPMEADLERPVARILIDRKVAQAVVTPDLDVKAKRGRPRKEVSDDSQGNRSH